MSPDSSAMLVSSKAVLSIVVAKVSVILPPVSVLATIYTLALVASSKTVPITVITKESVILQQECAPVMTLISEFPALSNVALTIVEIKVFATSQREYALVTPGFSALIAL